MVALKEPHLAELGWHDESQPEQAGGHNDNVPVQRAKVSLCRSAPCCSENLCPYTEPNFHSFIHICRLQSW